MTLKQRVKDVLQDYPKARERSNRYFTIWNIMRAMYPHHEMIDKEFYTKEAGKLMFSINRLINYHQKYNEELRGTDYSDGEIFAQEKKLELGYMPGYHKDVKTLNSLFPNDQADN